MTAGVPDPSVYEAKRRGINDSYTSQSATNAYSRFLSQQRGERTIGDYTRDFKRAVPGYTAGYAKRGLAGGGVQSGVYQNAMRNYVGDYGQNLNRLYADQQNETNQFDLNQANLQAQRDRAIADMEVDKAREIANAAYYLNVLRGQGGTA